MIMLLDGWNLGGPHWRSRLGYAAIAFGVWDIFYYVFLKMMCGWPHSLVDWDILFLIPLPWWGPVLAPVLIASLMIAWGTLATSFGMENASILADRHRGVEINFDRDLCWRCTSSWTTPFAWQDQGLEAVRTCLPHGLTGRFVLLALGFDGRADGECVPAIPGVPGEVSQKLHKSPL